MNNKDRFEEKCYRAYQLDWMLSHGYGFNDLFEIIVGLAMEAVEETPMASATNGNSVRNLAECAAEEFWTEAGFDGRLYACKEEFLGAEYKDAGYMKHLTSMMPDPEKQYASWRKYSGTERVEDLEIERVLTISTGHISTRRQLKNLTWTILIHTDFPYIPKENTDGGSIFRRTCVGKRCRRILQIASILQSIMIADGFALTGMQEKQASPHTSGKPTKKEIRWKEERRKTPRADSITHLALSLL